MKNIYREITSQIIAAIERGNLGEWRMPWHTDGDFASLPVNAITKKSYRGVNILALWAAAQNAGYADGRWATYQQWNSIGAQVRKGERSTLVVFWKFTNTESTDDDEGTEGEDEPSRAIVLVRGYNVFNAAQVENAPVPLEPETTGAGAHRDRRSFFQWHRRHRKAWREPRLLRTA